MTNAVPDLERAVIEVFGGCNYKCQMCPQTDGRGKGWTRKMPLDLFESVLDQLPGNPIIDLEGSGEATLAPDLPAYVEACTRRGFKSYMYTNGSKLHGDMMKDVIDAGLSFVRFSIIGYNPELYLKWMSEDRFEEVKGYAIKTKDYIAESGSDCEVSSYHLILDDQNVAYEVEQYRKNFIDQVGSVGYIWKMHNWSGNYSPDYVRDPSTRRTCGRPFAPEITVRSGGIDGQRGAVTPCCQTMGPPNEEKSVLGHMDSSSLRDVYFGDAYEELRKAHEEKRFDDIEYCSNCDFLYDSPEVLVWSNDPKASTDYMLGTAFSLNDYKVGEEAEA
jgi:MoaA/NifB/PqqE/SkfB family radical SAM enzyme